MARMVRMMMCLMRAKMMESSSRSVSARYLGTGPGVSAALASMRLNGSGRIGSCEG